MLPVAPQRCNAPVSRVTAAACGWGSATADERRPWRQQAVPVVFFTDARAVPQGRARLRELDVSVRSREGWPGPRWTEITGDLIEFVFVSEDIQTPLGR